MARRKKICKMFDKNQVDSGRVNLIKLINKSKLVIHTYNSTGFLETLAANKPTIIFFNNTDYPLNIEAKKYFNYLKDANILFYNWKEAVLFLNNNYNSIDNWWNSNKTQDARNKFCSNFVKLNDNKIDKLVKIIRKI
jgi:putative transferase (TIGR04331 family)